MEFLLNTLILLSTSKYELHKPTKFLLLANQSSKSLAKDHNCLLNLQYLF